MRFPVPIPIPLVNTHGLSFSITLSLYITFEAQYHQRFIALSMNPQETIPCYLGELPPEILAMIFGVLNIADLPNLLRTSKWIKAIPYSSSLTRV
jgi:hypothetical protein